MVRISFAIKKLCLAAGILPILPLLVLGQALRYIPEAKGTLVNCSLDFDSEHKQPNGGYCMPTRIYVAGTTPEGLVFQGLQVGAGSRVRTIKITKGAGMTKVACVPLPT